MVEGLVDWALVNVDPAWMGFAGALLVGWVAVVYLAMGFGVRAGDLVFAGRHVGRLPREQRWWGLLYGALLLTSGFILLELAGALSTNLIPDSSVRSAGFVVAAVLGVATVFCSVNGSRWERMLFVPITLLGSALAAWLTFA